MERYFRFLFISIYILVIVIFLFLIPYFQLCGFYIISLLNVFIVISLAQLPYLEDPLNYSIFIAKKTLKFSSIGSFLFFTLTILYFFDVYLTKYFKINWEPVFYSYGKYNSISNKSPEGWGDGNLKIGKKERQTHGAIGFWFTDKNGKFIEIELRDDTPFILKYNCNVDLVLGVSFENNLDQPLSELKIVQAPSGKNEINLNISEMKMIYENGNKFKHLKINYLLVNRFDSALINVLLQLKNIGGEELIKNAYLSLR